MPGPASNPLRRLYRWGLRLAQGTANRLGLTVAPTADYYSPLPVLGRLAASRRRWDRPSELVGLTWDLEAMRALLGGLVERWGAEYGTLPPYAELKRQGYGPGFTEVDALVLYSMVRDLKPRRYLEIGSGLSTYYAWLAASRNRAEGVPCEISCVDPYSTNRLGEIDEVEIVRREVQDVETAYFEQLAAGDLLFIDSTHVVKIDGDVPFLYLEAVPRLAPGVVVHSHDVHFPYNVPHPVDYNLFAAKWPRYWTEAMLLQAFLAFNDQFEILLSAPLLRHHDEPFLAARLPGYRPLDPADTDTHAGSLWYRRRPA